MSKCERCWFLFGVGRCGVTYVKRKIILRVLVMVLFVCLRVLVCPSARVLVN